MCLILMSYEDAADFRLQAPEVRSLRSVLPALGKDLFTFYQEISIHLVWWVTRWSLNDGKAKSSDLLNTTMKLAEGGDQ